MCCILRSLFLCFPDQVHFWLASSRTVPHRTNSDSNLFFEIDLLVKCFEEKQRIWKKGVSCFEWLDDNLAIIDRV
jgi:hypothetical protein